MPKRKREKKSGRRKRRSWIFGSFLILLLVALVVLVPILLYQLGLVNNVFANLHIEKQEFLIEDDCSVIAGNIMHTIEDEGDCKHRCKNNCGVRELFFYDSEFIEKVGDCHECKCYCR